jgi:hypothetical protein
VAYHLTFADDEDVMVAYLLEITHKCPEDDGEPSIGGLWEAEMVG